MRLCVPLLRKHLEFGRKNGGFYLLFQDTKYKCKKRVVMTTMRLHNFIKIFNYADDDFANTMLYTRLNNIYIEYDVVDTEELDATHIEQMTQIRDNIANIFWENQNNR